MAVTSDYYYDTYHGVEFADIDTYLARAEDMIQNIISSDPEGDYQQTHYSKAVCAQAEAIGLSGGLAVWLFHDRLVLHEWWQLHGCRGHKYCHRCHGLP